MHFLSVAYILRDAETWASNFNTSLSCVGVRGLTYPGLKHDDISGDWNASQATPESHFNRRGRSLYFSRTWASWVMSNATDSSRILARCTSSDITQCSAGSWQVAIPAATTLLEVVDGITHLDTVDDAEYYDCEAANAYRETKEVIDAASSSPSMMLAVVVAVVVSGLLIFGYLACQRMCVRSMKRQQIVTEIDDEPDEGEMSTPSQIGHVPDEDPEIEIEIELQVQEMADGSRRLTHALSTESISTFWT